MDSKSEKAGARERLIDTAMHLFMQQGVRATGIDLILRDAGVAKMSLYKHFRGKDDLVVAVLERRHEVFAATFLGVIETRQSPRGRILGVFDALERWFARPDFRGCLFLNVAAELSDGDCEARGVIARHKGWMEAQFVELCVSLGVSDAAGLARRLMVVFEGAISRAYVEGHSGSARDARAVAEALLGDGGSA